MFAPGRARRVRVVALVVALAATVLAAPAFAAGTVSPRHILDAPFADPEIFVEGGTYYAYASRTSALRVPVATATDPEGPWTVQGAALTRYPTWALKTGPDAAMWAPDVSKRPDGTYLMLFTANDPAQELMCIAAATSTSPLGPFVPDDSGPVICPPDPLHGAIDASTYSEGGKHYVLYKTNGNAHKVNGVQQNAQLFIQEVKPDGTTLVGGPTSLLQAQGADDDHIIEAPDLVKNGDEYILFFSTGSWLRTYGVTGYATSYARADSLKGPYTRSSRKLMAGPVNEEGQNEITQGVLGPGGADVVDNKIFFHGRKAEGETRTFWVSDLGWSYGGRPVVRGSKFRYEAETQPKNDVVVKSKDGASEGKVVGSMDSATSWVEARVTAPVAGSYTMRIGYYAGYGNASHKLTINGDDAAPVSYTGTSSWTTRNQKSVNIELKAGINYVRLTKSTGYADLDYIDVS